MDTAALTSRRRAVAHALAARPARRWRIGRVDDGDGAPEGQGRRWSSRQLHRLGQLASHAWAGATVALVAVGWVGLGAVEGFPVWWFDGLAASTSIVTVVMLFVLQHLQARDQLAVQRKLDEILRALPGADNRLIALEDAADETLEVLAELNRADRLT
ncbi:MAG TPA: low affinity iron permease family protein [Acidimicrobiales bacterium]|nr:low affinity iron permease family protein [Acidimicrobiales bacterium]